MLDVTELAAKTETLARDYLRGSNFPADVPKKSVRGDLHSRVNDILQRDGQLLIIGEPFNPRDRRQFRHIITDAVSEALSNLGYQYNESRKCYEDSLSSIKL